jgi:hypothetical protein
MQAFSFALHQIQGYSIVQHKIGFGKKMPDIKFKDTALSDDMEKGKGEGR